MASFNRRAGTGSTTSARSRPGYQADVLVLADLERSSPSSC